MKFTNIQIYTNWNDIQTKGKDVKSLLVYESIIFVFH